MTAFLLIFLIGGQIENQLLSTGAFEVYLNGEWFCILCCLLTLVKGGSMKEVLSLEETMSGWLGQ